MAYPPADTYDEGGAEMMRRLAGATVLAAAASVGALATPAAAATTCSSLFCFQYGPTSATAWTNLGPVSGSVTIQLPQLAIAPLPSA